MIRYLHIAVLSLMVLVGTANAQEMAGHGDGMGHGGDMKGCGMMGGGMSRGMMGGGMGHGMMGGRGGGAHGTMGAYHHWIHGVMMHRDTLGLSADQIERIEALSANHAQSAITNQAKDRVLDIDYKQAMRKKSVDQKTVERILRQQADLQYERELQGVIFYTQVLELMTPEQKERLWDQVGSPFPRRWEMRPADGHPRQDMHAPMHHQPGHHPSADDTREKSSM